MAFSVTAKFAPGALERQVDYEIVAFLSEKKNSCKPFRSDMHTTGVVLVFEQLPLEQNRKKSCINEVSKRAVSITEYLD